MAAHDTLFKQLLETLLGDFLELVVPHLAPRLDLERRRTLPNETFTDLPGGDRRQLDLVAEVPARSDTVGDIGDESQREIVLVHVEIERDRRASMGHRMWDYARTLALREGKPVLPIVLYLRGGPTRPVKRTVEQKILDETLATFSYYAFGLSGSPAAEYVARPQPLAWALAALMKPAEGWSPARHRIECLEPIARAPIDEATRALLWNCVETYVKLSEEDREEFVMLERERKYPRNYPRLEDVEKTYFDEVAEKASAEGWAKGETEGRVGLVLRLLERRFGELTETVRATVGALRNDELDDLALRLLDARSLEELGLTGA